LSPYSLDGVSDDLVHTLKEKISFLETELCEQGCKNEDAIQALNESFMMSSLNVHPTGRGPAPPDSNWVLLGREHEELTVPENSLLRYGLNKNWVAKRHSGKFKATNEFFGHDPLYGTGKVVEMWVQ
jgi:hypothetical protein